MPSKLMVPVPYGNRAVDRAVRAHDRNVTFGNPIRIPMAPEMLIMDST